MPLDVEVAVFTKAKLLQIEAKLESLYCWLAQALNAYTFSFTLRLSWYALHSLSSAL